MSYSEQDFVAVVKEMGEVASRVNCLVLSAECAVSGQAHSAKRRDELRAVEERCAESKRLQEEAVRDAIRLEQSGVTPGSEFRLRVNHFVSTAKYLMEFSSPDRQWTGVQGKNDLVLLKLLGIDLCEQFEAIRRELAIDCERTIEISSSRSGEKFRKRSTGTWRWARKG